MIKRVLSFFLLLFFVACSSFDNASSEVCFVGDSITDLWDVEKFFPEYKSNKHAVSGAILEDVSKWKTGDCNGVPTVMLIGTNNLWRGMEGESLNDEFVKTFLSKYIAQVRSFEASIFYAISILPRNREHNEPKYINVEIQKLNSLIYDSLQESKLNFKFIDVYENFLESENQIHWDYYSDGLHLTEEGYEILSYKLLEAF